MSESSYPGRDRRDRAWIKDLASEAVDQTFTRLGFDITDPTAIQQDMAMLRTLRIREQDDEVQKDRAWMRTARIRCDKILEQGLGVAVKVGATAIVVGTLGYFGIKLKGDIP